MVTFTRKPRKINGALYLLIPTKIAKAMQIDEDSIIEYKIEEIAKNGHKSV